MLGCVRVSANLIYGEHQSRLGVINLMMNLEDMHTAQMTGLMKKRLEGASRIVPTCGSVLILDVGQHLNIVEDYYAPGSIGSFSLQFTVSVENYGAQVSPELVVICMNSGSFATSVVHHPLTLLCLLRKTFYKQVRWSLYLAGKFVA